MAEHISTEKLFSYGTLQNAAVQIATFKRRLRGIPDTLVGFKLSTIEIKDQHVLATSGELKHPIVSFTGNEADQVVGMVFEITTNELKHADAYEVEYYKRVNIKLRSGICAWVYINATD